MKVSFTRSSWGGYEMFTNMKKSCWDRQGSVLNYFFSSEDRKQQTRFWRCEAPQFKRLFDANRQLFEKLGPLYAVLSEEALAFEKLKPL